MPNYNNEYFFLSPNGEKCPRLDRMGEYTTGLCCEKLDEKVEFFSKISNTAQKQTKVTADCFIYFSVYLVVSDRLKQALEEFPLKDVQFVPMTIIDRREQEHKGYYILNAYNRIDCMDMEKSDYSLNWLSGEEDVIDSVEKAILDDTTLDAVPLLERLVFTLGKSQDSAGCLLFHKSVIDKLLEMDFVGLDATWMPGATLGRASYRLESATPSAVQVTRTELTDPDYKTAKQIISVIAAGVAQGDYYYDLLETACGEGKKADESTLINWAEKFPALYPELRTLIESIVTYSTKYNTYLEDAGEGIAVYLACQNLEDIALFVKLLGSYDLDHADEEEIAHCALKISQKWEGYPEIDVLSGYIEYLEMK